MKTSEPTQEHRWLGRLVGNWQWSHDVPDTGDTKVTHLVGREVYRAIGAFWVQGESVGPTPDGGMAVSQTTLTWDPEKGRFAGSWIGSVMPMLWVYDGELDAAKQTLALYSEGPAMDGSGRRVPYRDVLRFVDDNTRTLTGSTRDADGTWREFMTVEYTRV